MTFDEWLVREHGCNHGWTFAEVDAARDAWNASAMIERDALAAENARLRRGAHPASTHCDNCGCDWLDNGLNPVGCPYCKQSEQAIKIEALRAEVERLRADLAGTAQPKRRPYNASGSLSEYGIFPDCDADQAEAGPL